MPKKCYATEDKCSELYLFAHFSQQHSFETTGNSNELNLFHLERI